MRNVWGVLENSGNWETLGCFIKVRICAKLQCQVFSWTFFIFNLSQNFIFKARAFHKPSDSMKGIFHCFALESDASTMIQYLILNSTGMFRRGSQSYKENDIKNGKMQGLACDCQEFFQRGHLWGSLSTLFVSSFWAQPQGLFMICLLSPIVA